MERLKIWRSHSSSTNNLLHYLLFYKKVEHIICSHVRDHLDRHSVLTSLQHGFREAHSCETQLLTTLQDLLYWIWIYVIPMGAANRLQSHVLSRSFVGTQMFWNPVAAAHKISRRACARSRMLQSTWFGDWYHACVTRCAHPGCKSCKHNCAAIQVKYWTFEQHQAAMVRLRLQTGWLPRGDCQCTTGPICDHSRFWDN